MTPIKILIPTDFSIQAEYAYMLVQRLSEQAAIDIHLLHVISVPDTVSMDAQGQITTCGEIDVRYLETQRDLALRKLQQFQALHAHAVQTHLLMGKLTTQIAGYALAAQFDLIVMGTKGATGIKEKVSGSETQMVARHSQVPVLSLRCDRSQLAMQHILLVHDFSDHKQQPFPVLHRLIQAFGLQVHLLQIVAQADEGKRAQVLNNMEQFATANGLHGAQYHVLRDRDVEAGVVHFPQLQDMDILCMGTHGKGGLFHHSIAEQLINHLAKPLLTYHLT